MSGISFAQQNHLAGLINTRIYEQIKAIQTEHADELRAIGNRAMDERITQLGVKAELDQLAAYQAQYKALEEQQTQLRREAADLREQLQQRLGYNYHRSGQGTPVDTSWYEAFNEELHTQAQAVIAQRAGATPWGARMVYLQAEQKALLDTIYLTTGNKEFAAVLARFNHLLGLSETPLQAQLSETRQLPPGAALQES